MPWNSTAPDGTKSVKENETIIQANTTYTETELNIDHFWSIGADEDGHHKYAQMPKYTDGAVATPTSPTLDAGMDLAYFSRLKTATEATASQDVQPYARNASDIMQILGIRSCGVIDVTAGVASIKYKHNISTVTYTATGKFKITFEVAFPMPSINYLLLGGAMRNIADATKNIFFVPDSGTTIISKKKTTECSFHTVATDGLLLEPLQVWFVCFGG